MNKILGIGILFLTLSGTAPAQKRPLEHSDFDTWKTITGEKLSPDGNFVLYHLSPGHGDVSLYIHDKNGKLLADFPRSESARFTADSKYVVFRIKPAIEDVYELKRKKTKSEDMPMDTLAIFDLDNKTINKIPNIRNHKVPEKWSGYIFYQFEVKSDQQEAKQKDKSKKPGKKNGYHLVIRNMESGTQDTLHFVTDFSLAEESDRLLYHTSGTDSIKSAGTYHLDISEMKETPMVRAMGSYKSLTLDKKGDQVVFLSDLDSSKSLIRNFELRYWTLGKDSALAVATTGHPEIPEKWIISKFGSLSFSDDGSKVYFSTKPQPLEKDTTLLPHEKVKVEVWHYQEKKLYTQQKVDLKEDNEKSYDAVYHTLSDRIVQLGSLEIPNVRQTDKKNSNYSLGTSNEKYYLQRSWDAYVPNDIYVIDNRTGSSLKIAEKVKGFPQLSETGKYVFWYDVEHGSLNSFDIEDKNLHVLNKNLENRFADELNDSPMFDSPYGIAGWTTGDQEVLVYDRYDIWSFDPTNQREPLNITNGRSKNQIHRYFHLDPEERAINGNEMLIHVEDENTRSEGIAYFSLRNKKKPLVQLVPYRISRPIKALNSNEVIYTKESFRQFPDLLISNTSFKKETKISEANPEYSRYKWGTVEMIQWTSLEGTQLNGLLYKPDDFDPSKKYPMIVSFYERNSQNLHRHWGIFLHRSTLNPTFYTSRGYVVFVPDIVYKIGYPGESCYNSVIPGVTSLLDKGYVDPKKVGVQGHSWGGYQIAYLITKSNIFAAAEAGAPVVNMFSAYGGIRWGSGYSRQFQYEQTQSRIGGTIWEYPIRYLENSPLFWLDKVETPVLIMHNDHDTAVPWYQGIEMFTALRRLQKPSWMLNYNDEPHWPVKWENKRDFKERLQEFFDHYLMDKPMPRWMAEPVPAVEKSDGWER